MPLDRSCWFASGLRSSQSLIWFNCVDLSIWSSRTVVPWISWSGSAEAKSQVLQDVMGSDHEWRRSYSFPLTKNEAQKSDVQPGFSSDAESLEETVSIVKGRVWSFREALKGVAEALVGYGLSPSVVGYSTVAIHEEGYVAEKDDGAAALQSVTDSEHEYVRSKSLPRGAEEFVPRSNPGEDSSLLHQVDEEEEDNHAFAESIRRDRDERKSLTRPGSWQFRNALEEDDDSK